MLNLVVVWQLPPPPPPPPPHKKKKKKKKKKNALFERYCAYECILLYRAYECILSNQIWLSLKYLIYPKYSDTVQARSNYFFTGNLIRFYIICHSAKIYIQRLWFFFLSVFWKGGKVILVLF